MARTPAPEDGRRQHLRMTPAGMRVFAPLEKRSQEQVRGMLTALDEEGRRVLLEAMDMIQNALDKTKGNPTRQLSLRGHRPGDLGWVVQRHGEIYYQEYGWNEEFEALVAEITAEFVRKLDVTRERCWIAEHDGRRVGCIFLVAKDATTAKLRLLLVDPEARGFGVGGTGCRVCAIRAGGRLPEVVLGPSDSDSGASPLHRGGLREDRWGAASQLRARSCRRNLGTRASRRRDLVRQASLIQAVPRNTRAHGEHSDDSRGRRDRLEAVTSQEATTSQGDWQRQSE